jgi:hypothetical protein
MNRFVINVSLVLGLCSMTFFSCKKDKGDDTPPPPPDLVSPQIVFGDSGRNWKTVWMNYEHAVSYFDTDENELGWQNDVKYSAFATKQAVSFSAMNENNKVVMTVSDSVAMVLGIPTSAEYSVGYSKVHPIKVMSLQCPNSPAVFIQQSIGYSDDLYLYRDEKYPTSRTWAEVVLKKP